MWHYEVLCTYISEKPALSTICSENGGRRFLQNVATNVIPADHKSNSHRCLNINCHKSFLIRVIIQHRSTMNGLEIIWYIYYCPWTTFLEMNYSNECPEVTSLVNTLVFRKLFTKCFGIWEDNKERLLIKSMEQQTS